MEKGKKLIINQLRLFSVGYGETHGIKGYRLFNPSARRILFSRNVDFEEDKI